MFGIGKNLEKALRIIVTGGTIDKVHDVVSESLVFSKDGATHMSEILKIGRTHFPVIQTLMLKDSLEFDDKDRDAIVEAINASNEICIVVTHGTGTMGTSAKWIAKRVSGKTIVLTGAMRPHSLSNSDGSFNMGGAILAAQLLPEGVYGVMNGRVIDAANLVKNTQFGRFDI